jgi:hypothetical protein
MSFQSRVASSRCAAGAVCVLVLSTLLATGAVAAAAAAATDTAADADAIATGNAPAVLEQARERGRMFERALAAMDRVMRVWLTHADARTLLLPDRVPGPVRPHPTHRTTQARICIPI